MAKPHSIHRDLTLECIHGVAVELRHALPEGWKVSEVDDSFVVTGTASEGFESNVWRIARFVAYPAFLSLERTKKDDTEVRYELVSQSARGPAFRVEFVLSVPA
jgi:hypothetical protein